MTFRGFTLAALLHGATIGLAFAVLPAQSSVKSFAELGKVAVEHQAESLEPAQLPVPAITPLQAPERPELETAPSFAAEQAPVEPVQPEILPDPADALPIREEPVPSRSQPTLKLPRPVREAKVSPSQRAAEPVESARDSADSDDFTPPALLSWTPPDSLLYHFRGMIVATIELSAEGKVRSVTLEEGTGDEETDQDVRKALSKGKYSPARYAGSGVAATMTRRFNIVDPPHG